MATKGVLHFSMREEKIPRHTTPTEVYMQRSLRGRYVIFEASLNTNQLPQGEKTLACLTTLEGRGKGPTCVIMSMSREAFDASKLKRGDAVQVEGLLLDKTHEMGLPIIEVDDYKILARDGNARLENYRILR